MSINEQETLKQLLILEDTLLISIADKQKKLDEVRKQINILKGDQGFAWMENAIACIENQPTLVTTDEILKWVFRDREEEFLLAHRRRGYIVALSVALNKLCKAGKLKSKKVTGIRGLFYGLPKWWENGELSTLYRILLDNKIRLMNNNV